MAELPDKLYYKIGEVADITGVKPYVLRYWESEFKIISPKKSVSKQRVYTKNDIEVILEIKRLLYKERFTLQGAKKKIKEFREERARQLALSFPKEDYRKLLKSIKSELNSIKKMLG